MPQSAVPPKPSVWGIVIGVCLFFLGPIFGSITMLGGAAGSLGAVSRATTFVADSSENSVSLKAGSQMGIWVFPPDSPGSCRVTDPDREHVKIDTNLGGSITVQDFQLIGEFVPPTTGVYTVSCQSDGTAFDYRVAASRSAGLWMVSYVGVGLIGVSFIGGVILVIVSVIRRSTWTSQYG